MSATNMAQPASPHAGYVDLFKRIYRYKHCYLLLLPSMVLLITFMYYPALAAFYYSFTDWDAFLPPFFVGLENYIEIFTEDHFRQAFTNMGMLTAFAVITSLTIPLFVAKLISDIKRDRWQHWYRLLFVIPIVVPHMVVWLLWRFILDPNFGLINSALAGIGFDPNTLPTWLGDPRIALYSLMLIGFPWVNGVNVLIYLAGLQGISESVMDSALVDGVNRVQMFFRIQLPLIVSQVKLILILTLINSVQAFQLQLILTNGGPGYSTTVPGLEMYKYAMSYNRMGFASAVGVVLFVIIFTLTVINTKYLKSAQEQI